MKIFIFTNNKNVTVWYVTVSRIQQWFSTWGLGPPGGSPHDFEGVPMGGSDNLRTEERKKEKKKTITATKVINKLYYKNMAK